MQLDIADLETHRRALTGHCYRTLGSVADAEDAVQETILRAWRNLERFEGRASVRTWLYRIAANACLDSLSDGARRARPMDEGPVGSVDSPLETRERTHWLEPIPDVLAIPRIPSAREHRARLESWLDGEMKGWLKEAWRLERQEQTLIELPRGAAVRNLMMNHAYHHRGQLAVYLRLLTWPSPRSTVPSRTKCGS